MYGRTDGQMDAGRSQYGLSCTKFQSSRPDSSWEKCDKNFLCLKIWEKDQSF